MYFKNFIQIYYVLLKKNEFHTIILTLYQTKNEAKIHLPCIVGMVVDIDCIILIKINELGLAIHLFHLR